MPGIATLNWLYFDQLCVDHVWSVDAPDGFTWWADGNAQSIEVVGEEAGPGGKVGHIVRVRTEVLRDFECTPKNLRVINTLLMIHAAMAGPVVDELEGSLSLSSLVRVYDGILNWMNPLVSVAAVLQIGEARIMAPALAEAVGAQVALSSPPGMPMRPVPDEMAEAIATIVAPAGLLPAQWSKAEFEGLKTQYIDFPPAVSVKLGRAGVTIEFPFGRDTSLCAIVADQPHPRYGNGLHLLQSFPVSGFDENKGIAEALKLNGIELQQKPTGYGFGSYVYRDGLLHFVSFIPNACYRAGLLPNMYFSCSERARAMSLHYTGIGWA